MEQGQEFWRPILKEKVEGIASSKWLKEVTVAISAVGRPQDTGRADITTAQVDDAPRKIKTWRQIQRELNTKCPQCGRKFKLEP